MSRTYIIIIGVNLLLAIFILTQQKVVIDWSQSYWYEDKIPHGTYILDQIITENESISELTVPISDFIEDELLLEPHTIIYLNKKLNNIHYEDRVVLDSLVKAGHQVILNGQFIPFHDSLHIKYTSFLDTLFDNDFSLIQELFEDENFDVNLSLGSNEIDIPVNVYGSLILPEDSCNCEVLATVTYENHTFPGIIRVNHGKGSYISNPYPAIFTNYGIMQNKEKMFPLIQHYMTFIDYPDHVLWDRYYVNGKRDESSSSLLRVLFRKQGMKFAYYFTLLGIAIFFVFEGRRKQQKIPVLKEPENATLQYARSISRLHIMHSSNETIYNKMINNWVTSIYEKSKINILEANTEDIEMIAEKTEIKKEELNYIIAEIKRIQDLTSVDITTMIALYKRLNSTK